jgi:hypothetical protein
MLQSQAQGELLVASNAISVSRHSCQEECEAGVGARCSLTSAREACRYVLSHIQGSWVMSCYFTIVEVAG